MNEIIIIRKVRKFLRSKGFKIEKYQGVLEPLIIYCAKGPREHRFRTSFNCGGSIIAGGGKTALEAIINLKRSLEENL